jgi:TolB protein
MSWGIFEGYGDVGEVRHAGNVRFDPATGAYSVTGSGENVWRDQDAFHFVWTRASGDVSLTATIDWATTGGDPHRKAILMIRQSQEADAAYADAALHGDGLTSLQFRNAAGETTHEIQTGTSLPRRVRIEKRGKYVRLFTAGDGDELTFSGAAVRLPFDGSFYVGIGVCAHQDDALETAVFSDLEWIPKLPESTEKPILYSTLETQNIGSTDRRVCYTAATHIEAPNWHPEGDALIVNRGGHLLKIPVAGGAPETIDTGFAVRCNNDHGISPDGRWIVISDGTETGKSLIYTLPIAGGTPTRITPVGPSYWHGWSPDGKTLAFCGQRDGKFGIFTIPADGNGPEVRLTITDGLDDGPEYGPDGEHLYFNSDRSGRMQIWRMRPDGSSLEQITDDNYNNWFAHPSPDGRYLTILSYEKSVVGHPPGQDVTLRLMTLATREITVLALLFGGQGTINVPCWSADSTRISFVSYQRV